MDFCCWDSFVLKLLTALAEKKGQLRLDRSMLLTPLAFQVRQEVTVQKVTGFVHRSWKKLDSGSTVVTAS